MTRALDARAALGDAFDAWLEDDRPRALAWAQDGLPADLPARLRTAARPLVAGTDHPTGEILLVGITGVGKSTLANAVLGREAAATGAGAPVTAGVDRLRSADGLTTVVDTEGLELGGEVAERRREHLVALARLADVVWYCVQAGPGRFGPTEAELVSALAGVARVIVVLTQSLEPPDALAAAIRSRHEDVPVVAILARERTLGARSFAPAGLRELFAAHRRCLSPAAPRPR